MLTSFALLFLLGLFLSMLFRRMHLPGLLGMLLTGIILGPYCLHLLSDSLLAISSDLRQLALVIILSRAGLALNINDLKSVGRPAILLCFVPACFEILGTILLAPHLLGISVTDAAVMGTVIAAVSPAVIVPKMLHLLETGYGTNKSIPQLLLAGASVDDVFVIVLFTAALGMAQGQTVSPLSLIRIPISILTGIAFGALCGIVLSRFFRDIPLRNVVPLLILLSSSFLLIALENPISSVLPFSGLLAIMSLCATVRKKHPAIADTFSSQYNQLWVGAEIMLFVLVGATVDPSYAIAAGPVAVALIFGALAFRMVGVYLCMLKTPLRQKERLFCMIAYSPKATVQAAIGAIPLSMGLACGSIVLTVAVLAIIITAPLGAFLIDLTYQRLLTQSTYTPSAQAQKS